MQTLNSDSQVQAPILVTGATGKTGHRVASRLEGLGFPVRRASRSAAVAFDWHDASTWDAALDGVEAVYLAFSPDLAVPGASTVIERFVGRAVQAGVRRIVLLSGRGEEEAEVCEGIVQASGLTWTVVRAAWFAQNFSEGEFLPMMLDGAIALPVRDVPEPFVDIDDLADVAVAALTQPGHAGEIYDVTGPELLTFPAVVDALSAAAGRPIAFVPLTREAFAEGLRAAGMPEDMVWLLDYLCTTVLDGRNARLGDGVQRALGRAPRSFGAYAQAAAADGVWESPEAGAAAQS
ncbi:MAG: NmrA family transcriptional regulator [Gammaproteobacteria bacterium]|nr:NmrA family transcriptional regulator [Gammaproteobacteria bacterium]